MIILIIIIALVATTNSASTSLNEGVINLIYSDVGNEELFINPQDSTPQESTPVREQGQGMQSPQRQTPPIPQHKPRTMTASNNMEEDAVDFLGECYNGGDGFFD